MQIIQNLYYCNIVAFIKYFEAWENDLVEVPGNEHHHNHEERNHSHEPVHVTAEEMLQLELKQRIEQIKKRVDVIANNFSNED